MSQKRDNALGKMRQAQHSLDLMKHVWGVQTPVLDGYSVEEEFRYYLSSFLNACYSATCMFDIDAKHLNEEMLSFRREHPQFCRRETGYRHMDTHSEPVMPEGKGYKPPQGDAVNFEPQPYTPVAWNMVNFIFKDELYFPSESEQTVIRRCSEHLADLHTEIQQICP